MTNVLLTSAGRRSYLVEYFKRALNGRGKVIAANMYKDAPAMYVADEAVVVPQACDENYIQTILDICKHYEIDLICSLHDLDVFILSKHISRFEQAGILPVLPDAEWGRICLDKYECYCHLKKNGFHMPWTDISLDKTLHALESGAIQFPLILKARMGFGSEGLNRCDSKEELIFLYNRIQKQISTMKIEKFFENPIEEVILIQQAIEGTEYCVDIVNDLNGKYITHLALEVHTMRAGETDFITTADPSIAADIPHRLSKLTKHRGIWGVDIIYDKGKPLIIDINPRFTGDYPYHHISGANIPAAILAWTVREEPDPVWLKSEIGVKCYKELVATRIS
jgi:carbamoyl-phosphate synthase large subunit